MKRKGLVIIAAVVGVLAISVAAVDLKDKEFKIVKNLDIFYSLFKEINYFYVDETDPEKLIQDGIDGMLSSLDPYTTFIPESELDEFAFMTTGKYGGIGAIIRKAGDFTMIAEPYEGFPANIAGLMAGDTIVEIDNRSIKGLSVKDVSDLLKGDPDTKVKVKIIRPGENKMITTNILRKEIKIDNVPYFGLIGNNTGYILLSNFTENASEEVKNALVSLKNQGAKSIILDLRGNPGGLLYEAVKIASVFVDKGTEVVSTKGKVKNWDRDYLTEDKPVDKDIPMAVLVNRGSASASEIVAGAMQDLDRAVIIGQRSFGKGLVQTSRPLSYNTKLKVTTAKYYIPSGRCIQAINYSQHNEDGSVASVPDSLIREFKTLNGRAVYDGGGIMPDIKTELISPKQITIALHNKGLIFDFATWFRINNLSIPSVNEFKITDDIYNDFIKFVKGKNFDYETESDIAIKGLIEKAKKEEYYDMAKDEFDALHAKLDHGLESDLKLIQDEISPLLKDEIVGRYYYQKGQIIAALENDEEIEKAVQALNDKQTYNSLLYIDENNPALVIQEK